MFWKNPGSWYRGNLHTHTSNSDGELAPAQIARAYRDKSYDFLCLSDHNRITPVEDLSDEDFLVIPGEEINLGNSGAGTPYHLLVFNLPAEISTEENTPPQEVIDAALSKGAEVIIAHPYWSALTINELLPLKGYLGIEIFNSSCLFSIAKGHALTHWDDLLIRGRRILGFATDDSHQVHNEHRPEDTAVSGIMVKAGSLSRENIMTAIRRGHFYSSSGPEIKEVSREGPQIRVLTSPVKIINFVADAANGESFTAPGEDSFTEAVYEVRGREKYIRVECYDGYGRGAWTNPIFPSY